jgi:hypothetical protein
MIYKQAFKTFEGCRKRCAFERAHAGDRGNVNFRFFPVRFRNGKPDDLAFDAAISRAGGYTYRIEKTLSDYPTDTRTL